jgi:hypothetical protein
MGNVGAWVMGVVGGGLGGMEVGDGEERGLGTVRGLGERKRWQMMRRGRKSEREREGGR